MEHLLDRGITQFKRLRQSNTSAALQKVTDIIKESISDFLRTHRGIVTYKV